MAYCNGTCVHLNRKKHLCEKTKEKLSYCKTIFGVVHEHKGYLECDNEQKSKEDR